MWENGKVAWAVVIGRQLVCDKGQLVEDYKHKERRTIRAKTGRLA